MTIHRRYGVAGVFLALTLVPPLVSTVWSLSSQTPPFLAVSLIALIGLRRFMRRSIPVGWLVGTCILIPFMVLPLFRDLGASTFKVAVSTVLFVFFVGFAIVLSAAIDATPFDDLADGLLIVYAVLVVLGWAAILLPGRVPLPRYVGVRQTVF